jgi:hypothetical protein
VPCYHLIGLEGDTKPLNEQSSSGDYAIILQENLSRFLNDFAPGSVKCDENSKYDINFESLSRLAVPLVGLHGNKEEMLTFLATRTPRVGAAILHCFDKPGLYAIVGNSLPSSVTSSHAKKRKHSSSSRTSRSDSSASGQGSPRDGQLTVYLVLWHTKDAFLQTFASNNKAVQLFAFLNALSTYRIALYSEAEGKHLLRIDSDLIASRQDITNVKILPESMRDISVTTKLEGGLLFSQTNMIEVDKVLVPSLLSTGLYGTSVATIPKIEFLGGTHSIGFHVMGAPEGMDAGQSKQQTVMAMAIDSVPNLLAQWGSNGVIDLTQMTDEEFSMILTDGNAPDWKLKAAQIESERTRVESMSSVPQFGSLESLVDANIRAHLRTSGHIQALDTIFQQYVSKVPENQRHSFLSFISDDITPSETAEQDDVLLKTYGDKLNIASLAPETPYLVALSRFALAKSSLKLVRLLKQKTPDEQTSFIINTMDSTEDEVNRLFESMQAYPEFEKTQHNIFQSIDLQNESEPRIIWYFISLYDNIIVQTRHYVMENIKAAGLSLETIQVSLSGNEVQAFQLWKKALISEYRRDLENRLKAIYDYKLLTNTVAASSHIRHVVTGYKRDATEKSVMLTLKEPPSSPSSASSRGDGMLRMDRQAVMGLQCSDWMVRSSFSHGKHHDSEVSEKLNDPGPRIFASSLRTIDVPSLAPGISPETLAAVSSKLPTSKVPPTASYMFCSSVLNVVINVLTWKSQNETQILASGGTLLGTLPVFCSHVAFSEDSQLMALCGDYIQLYRLLDGCRALSTVPFLSFHLDSSVYGALEQVVISGETCYFYTSQKTSAQSASGLNGPNAPALPARPDGVGTPGRSSETVQVCHIYKATSSGACVRLSPPAGVPKIQSLAVLPSQSHILLIRDIPGQNEYISVELWLMTGLTVSVFSDIQLKHPSNSVKSLRLINLNGKIYLASCADPTKVKGKLHAKLHMTLLEPLLDPNEKDAAITRAMRKTLPCENYLAYFAEVAMKFTTTPAVVTGAQNAARQLQSRRQSPLRVLISTTDEHLFTQFHAYIDRYRTLMRFAVLSTEKLQVTNAAMTDVFHPLVTSLGGATMPQNPKQEPIVPYLHHSLIKVKTTKEFGTKHFDDIAEEAHLQSLASFLRALLCSVPVPLLASNSRGSLVACLHASTQTLPHSQVLSFRPRDSRPDTTDSSSAPSSSSSPAPSIAPLPIPNQVAPLLGFGMIEALISSWKLQTKIVTSFGSVGTGKSSLLNHMFGTYFDTSSPHKSPVFSTKYSAPIASSAANPVGALFSVVPTATTLYIVVDFEALMSQKSVREQQLSALFNLCISNLTLWRTATPFIDEHYELLRGYSMERDHLVTYTQNPANRPLLPWPKSYNSLLVLADTARITDLPAANAAHYDLAKSSIKYYETNPGPHAKPVLHMLFKNRFATAALPLPARSLASHMNLSPQNWILGPMITNYLHQDRAYYQSLSDYVATFLTPAFEFHCGLDALNHIKRHMSYILWSQTLTIEVPPRMEQALSELSTMATNALIFGQQIRIGTQQQKQPISSNSTDLDPKPKPNDYVHQRQDSQVSKEGERVTIDPLADLSDPSKVVGCPQLDFTLVGIPEPITRDWERLQQYFPEEGLVLPIGAEPLPFNPQSKQEWSYYSYIDVILLWNRHVCDREHVIVDSDWSTSLQLFMNLLITRRALRVDFWIQLHTADIPMGTSLHRKLLILREKVACQFEKIASVWKLCGQSCNSCYYTCTLQAGHIGSHDCLVPTKHVCTSKCPKCQANCPFPAGHRRDQILHKCPSNCQRH